MLEQIQIEGLPPLTSDLIINNAEKVTDFFGDNLEAYNALKLGGSSWSKTNLEDIDLLSNEDPEKTMDEIGRPPLSVNTLKNKAVQVVAFLNANPKYLEILNEYLK